MKYVSLIKACFSFRLLLYVVVVLYQVDVVENNRQSFD